MQTEAREAHLLGHIWIEGDEAVILHEREENDICYSLDELKVLAKELEIIIATLELNKSRNER